MPVCYLDVPCVVCRRTVYCNSIDRVSYRGEGVFHEECYSSWKVTEDLRRCGVSHHNKFHDGHGPEWEEVDGVFARCSWCHEWVDTETNLALPYEMQGHWCWWCQDGAQYLSTQCMRCEQRGRYVIHEDDCPRADDEPPFTMGSDGQDYCTGCYHPTYV